MRADDRSGGAWMSIFEKVLDAFRLENIEEKRGRLQERFSSSDEETFNPISVKKFWEIHDLSHENRLYRRPSFSEMQEYAKADVISFFEKPRSNEKPSDFHLSQIGVTNWYRFFEELFKTGYIRKATPEETFNAYTLKDLKIIAESIGAKKSGKKAELIDRLCSSLSDKELNEIVQEENLFVTSKKGQKYLAYQRDLAELRTHSIYDVSLAEFNDKRYIGDKKRNFYDTMFQVLNEQKYFYSKNKNYTALSIICLRIYDIMMEEFERTDNNVPIDVMMTNYIEYLYLYICFPWEAYRLIETQTLYEEMIYEPSYVSLPNIKTNLIKFENYKTLINFNVVFTNKPPGFMTKKDFISMIDDFFESPMFDYSKWNAIIQNNFRKYTKSFGKRRALW